MYSTNIAAILFPLIALYAALSTAQTDQKCYAFDGTELDFTFAPCNSGADHSGCCATNRSSHPDICLDSGLCMKTSDEFVGTIWQAGCTDETGKDVACPNFCPSAQSSTWNIQTCDFGTYCCRAANDRRSCCNDATAPKITASSLGALQLQPPIASSSSSPASSAPSSPSTSPPTSSSTTLPSRALASAVSTLDPSTLTPSPNHSNDHPTCEKERHATAAVGATLSSILGSAILALSALLFWTHKKEKRQRRLKEHYEAQFGQNFAYRRTLVVESELPEIPREVALDVLGLQGVGKGGDGGKGEGKDGVSEEVNVKG